MIADFFSGEVVTPTIEVRAFVNGTIQVSITRWTSSTVTRCREDDQVNTQALCEEGEDRDLPRLEQGIVARTREVS